MNKKLVLATALVFGVAGLILAQGTVKAQDVNAADNSVANSDNNAPATVADNTVAATDNTAAATDNTAAATDNAVAPVEAPAANAAQ